jgi:hypothetical protein
LAGNFSPIYCCEESLRIQRICATYCVWPASARRGKNNRCVSHSAEYIFGGAPAIGTNRERHWEVYCCVTALRSSYSRFSLGKRLEAGIGKGKWMIDKCPLFSKFHPRLRNRCFSLHMLFGF